MLNLSFAIFLYSLTINFVLQLPDLKDAEAVQKFFLEEIQLGEELLAQGDFERGVDHLTNAIAVCGQPQQLLQVLQQTLPPPVFQMLLTKLPTISQQCPKGCPEYKSLTQPTLASPVCCSCCLRECWVAGVPSENGWGSAPTVQHTEGTQISTTGPSMATR
uniref:Translocase of outer mitochondrial membrane 20 n=1 Tax=Leptobrachium leishanense TaxID=445787 RepID=A0A8C5Q3E3_9ANUR